MLFRIVFLNQKATVKKQGKLPIITACSGTRFFPVLLRRKSEVISKKTETIFYSPETHKMSEILHILRIDIGWPLCYAMSIGEMLAAAFAPLFTAAGKVCRASCLFLANSRRV